MLQLLPPQQDPPDSTTVRRFFSSEIGASVIGAGCCEVVMASMLPIGPSFGGAPRAATIRHSGAPPFWQVGQYWAVVPEKARSRTVSPQTGHASPVRP